MYWQTSFGIPFSSRYKIDQKDNLLSESGIDFPVAFVASKSIKTIKVKYSESGSDFPVAFVNHGDIKFRTLYVLYHILLQECWNINKYMTLGEPFELSLIWEVVEVSSSIRLEVMIERT